MDENGIKDLLMSVIKTAQIVWPETIYGYRKIQHTYHPGRGGRRGYHTTVICGPPPPEITKEEYDNNVEMGQKDDMDAFLSKSKHSYYTFGRYVKEDGWYEKLKTLIADVFITELEKLEAKK